MMAYQISRTGREEAIELSRKFGLDQAAMIEVRRLLEEKQAAEHAAINANIRAAAGYEVNADAQPAQEQDQAAAPAKIPNAYAGNGATVPGVDVETTADKMNRWFRARGRGFA
jgi:hypothetical protein